MHDGNPARQAVCAAINLAEKLNTALIAEGVESSEQARFLLSAGCKICTGNHRQVDFAGGQGAICKDCSRAARWKCR